MNIKNRKFQYLSLLSIITIAVLLLLPTKSHAMEPIQQVLVQDGEFGHQVRQVWNAFLGFANTVMVIALLVIAFANILHIQLDKYAVKKILPSLIMAIVLANFSFFICRFLIDIANMVLNFVLTAGGSGTSGKILESINIKTTADPKVGMSNFWGVLWGFLLVHVGRLVGAIFIAILGYLFFIRNWVIYFLVALSPLAFIAMAIPQGQSVFSTWWKQFIQWVFMPVVSAFWLWVGGQFLSAMGTSAGATISFAFTIACFYFAFTTPFKMGGAIMKGWSSFGKKAAGLGLAPAALSYNRWGKPFVGEKVSQIQSWYNRTGSVNGGFIGNTFGAMRRWQKFNAMNRAEIMRAVQTSDDQLGREAMGGKYGQFGVYGRKDRRSKRITRFQNTREYNDSETGETDWVMKDLYRQFYEGEGGLESLARSRQYDSRIKETEARTEARKSLVAALANMNSAEDNVVLGNVDENYRKAQIANLMREKKLTREEAEKQADGLWYLEKEMGRRKAEYHSDIANREKMKRAGDSDNQNASDVYPLHQIVSERDRVKKGIAELESIANRTPEQEAALGQMRRHLDFLKQAFDSQLEDIMTDYWDEEKQVWRTEAADVVGMLGRKHEYDTFDTCKTMYDVHDIPEHEGLRKLYDSRMRKRYKEVLMNEEAASAGKREYFEARGKAESLGGSNGALTYYLTGNDILVKGDLARQLRGEIGNAIKKAGQDPALLGNVQSWVDEHLYINGSRGYDENKSKQNRQDLAIRIAAALNSGANRKDVLEKATETVNNAGVHQAGTREYEEAVAKEAAKLTLEPFHVTDQTVAQLQKALSYSMSEGRVVITERNVEGLTEETDTEWRENAEACKTAHQAICENLNFRDKDRSDTMTGWRVGIERTNPLGKEPGAQIESDAESPRVPGRASSSAD